MGRYAWLMLCLPVSACAGSAISRATVGSAESIPPANVAAADGTVLRRVLGQDALDQPLLPQPGDVWADVLPPAQLGPSVVPPASVRARHSLVEAAESDARAPHRPEPAVTMTGQAPATAAVIAATGLAPATAAAAAAAMPRQPHRSAPTLATAGQLHPSRPVIATPARPVSSAPVIAATPAEAVRPVQAVARAMPEPAQPVAAMMAEAGARDGVKAGALHPMVQLAAADSARSAEAEWQRLRQHAPNLTHGHKAAVSEAEVNGQHVWRLRASGFADMSEASAFCSGIRAVKANCWVVPTPASP